MITEIKFKIAVFILCHNEKEILPHVIKHYKEFCNDIYILNNESTDETPEIAKNMGCNVINYVSNEINELQYLYIKQNCYKPFRNQYDYIIICDADEFLYHKNLSEYLEKHSDVDVFKCVGYEMLHEDFDYKHGDYKKVKLAYRSPLYDKCLLFKSNIDIIYEVGCHASKNQHFNSEILIKHMKHLNTEYVCNRYQYLQTRLSKINLQNNWGVQYQTHKDKIIELKEQQKNKSINLEW